MSDMVFIYFLFIQARTNNRLLIPVIRQNQHPAHLLFDKVEDTLKVKTTKNLTLFLLHKLTRQNQKESVEIDSLDIKLLDSFNGAPLQTFNGHMNSKQLPLGRSPHTRP